MSATRSRPHELFRWAHPRPHVLCPVLQQSPRFQFTRLRSVSRRTGAPNTAEIAAGGAVIVVATHVMGFPRGARTAIICSLLAGVLLYPVARRESFDPFSITLVGGGVLLGDLLGYRLQRLQRSFCIDQISAERRCVEAAKQFHCA